MHKDIGSMVNIISTCVRNCEHVFMYNISWFDYPEYGVLNVLCYIVYNTWISCNLINILKRVFEVPTCPDQANLGSVKHSHHEYISHTRGSGAVTQRLTDFDL